MVKKIWLPTRVLNRWITTNWEKRKQLSLVWLSSQTCAGSLKFRKWLARQLELCGLRGRMNALGVDRATLTHFWRTRVHLEYHAPLWHFSITMAQATDLARVHCVAMAAITGQWHPSHTGQLEELSLEPMDTRRTHLCRRFAVQGPDTRTSSRPRQGGGLIGARQRTVHGAALKNCILLQISSPLPDQAAEYEIVPWHICDMWTMVSNQSFWFHCNTLSLYTAWS